jgi:hypothetical protein
MRFISLFTHVDKGVPPTQDEMAKMGKLVEEGMKAGWLIATEGVHGGSNGFRVQSTGGKIEVTDGPFAEAKEQLGGFWIITAPDLDAALKWAAEGSAACGGPVEVRPFQEVPES